MLTPTTESHSGTCLQGYVTTPYKKLVEVFGPPNGLGDEYKVDAEWVLRNEEGTIVTIYNYKDGQNYLGEEGTPTDKIIYWHIGGKGKAAVVAVAKILPTATPSR